MQLGAVLTRERSQRSYRPARDVRRYARRCPSVPPASAIWGTNDRPPYARFLPPMPCLIDRKPVGARQRCQVASTARSIAARRQRCAASIASLGPSRPRALRLRRKSTQKVETVLNSVRWRFGDAIGRRSSNTMCAGLSRPTTGARPASTPERSQSAPGWRSRCRSASAPRAGRRGTGSPPPGPSPVRCRVFGNRIAVLDLDRGSFCRLGVAVFVAGKAHGVAREMPDAVWTWDLGLGEGRLDGLKPQAQDVPGPICLDGFGPHRRKGPHIRMSHRDLGLGQPHFVHHRIRRSMTPHRRYPSAKTPPVSARARL